MRCELCDKLLEHAPGCPYDTPVGSQEREDYLRGMRDGKARDVFKPAGPYYVDGYRNAVGAFD